MYSCLIDRWVIVHYHGTRVSLMSSLVFVCFFPPVGWTSATFPSCISLLQPLSLPLLLACRFLFPQQTASDFQHCVQNDNNLRQPLPSLPLQSLSPSLVDSITSVLQHSECFCRNWKIVTQPFIIRPTILNALLNKGKVFKYQIPWMFSSSSADLV